MSVQIMHANAGRKRTLGTTYTIGLLFIQKKQCLRQISFLFFVYAAVLNRKKCLILVVLWYTILKKSRTVHAAAFLT